MTPAAAAPTQTRRATEEVERYINQCSWLRVEPDPSVLITLKTHWHVLAPSFPFGEGKVLPLLDVLSSERCSVKRLVLRTSKGMHRTDTAWSGEAVSCDARALACALTVNKSITELDLASCGLRDLGVAELATAIECSPHILRVDLRRNAFGAPGCRALRDAIIRGKAAGTCGLEELDVSMNGLGHKTVALLRSALASHPKLKLAPATSAQRATDRESQAALKSCASTQSSCATGQNLILSLKIDEGNYTTEELLNALTHGIGCALALVGSVPLLNDAALQDRATFWMCFVYSATLVFCFASSCAYHACFQLPTAFKYLQRADHAAIYLLIAGSYTPFLGVGMRDHLGATAILVLVWIVGAIGSLTSAAGIGLTLSSINPLEVCVYAAMGLAVLPIVLDVQEVYPPEAFVLLVLGGAAYLIGIIFFVAGSVHPMLHVVWHLFVLTGAFAHWFAIYLHLVPMADMRPKEGPVRSPTDNVRAQLLDAEQTLASVASSIFTAMLHERNISKLPAHIIPTLLAAFSHRNPDGAARLPTNQRQVGDPGEF